MAAGTEFNAMVGECHPYLQLFSSLVRHGGMTKSSACRREKERNYSDYFWNYQGYQYCGWY